MPRNIQTGWSAPNVIAVDPSSAIVDGTLDVSGTPGLETLVAAGVLAGGTITSPGGTISLATGAGLSNPASGTIANSGVLAIAQGTVTATGTITASTGLTLTGTTLTASGGVASVVAGAGLTTSLTSTNGTIASSGTLSAIESVSAQTGTSYAFASSDRANLITFSNASAIAATIAQAGTATFPAGWFVDFLNVGTGLLTITPTTSTIAGVTAFRAKTGFGGRIVSDGTNYLVQNSAALYSLASSAVSNWLPGIPSSTLGGNARGSNALDIQSVRNNATQVASGISSVAYGNYNVASGLAAVAVGYINSAAGQDANSIGNSNNASGQTSSALGYNNSATNTSATAAGSTNTASDVNATAVGSNNLASANDATAVGSSNLAQDDRCSAIGYGLTVQGEDAGSWGSTQTTTGDRSFAIGYKGDDRGNVGALVRSTVALGTTGTKYGRSQLEDYTFVHTTSGSSAVRLTADGAAAAGGNVAALGTSSTQMFDCWFSVTDISNGRYVQYYMAIPASISKGANNASTTLGTPGPVFTAADASATPITLAAAPTITADTTNGGYNLSYTPPVANTNALYAVAVIRVLNTRFN